MRGKRLRQTLRLYTILASTKRTKYLRDKHIFGAIGENCNVMNRTIPLYAKLIKLGNNVRLASHVTFVTHDVTHVMLNANPSLNGQKFKEKIGCIEIQDNVFVGASSTILYGVRIGANVIVGAGSLVNKDVPSNSVVGGVPARIISTFDEYISKRTSEENYPETLGCFEWREDCMMQQTQVNKLTVQIQPIHVEQKRGFYEKYIKRLLDIICSLAAIIVFCWLYIIVAVLVRVKLGSSVLFKQPRPGKVDPRTGQESIFYMYKFRSMSDERDENGELLPDVVRLGKFGKTLRATSLDELPEVFNILKGDMSVIGPRPQLVRDMVFMTEEQRRRHSVRPGLSGLAQVNGRNAIKWEDRLNWDLEYIKKISFIGDLEIIIATVKNALFRHEGVNENGMATSEDFGDYLLRTGRITQEQRDAGFYNAKEMINEFEEKIRI